MSIMNALIIYTNSIENVCLLEDGPLWNFNICKQLGDVADIFKFDPSIFNVNRDIILGLDRRNRLQSIINVDFADDQCLIIRSKVLSRDKLNDYLCSKEGKLAICVGNRYEAEDVNDLIIQKACRIPLFVEGYADKELLECVELHISKNKEEIVRRRNFLMDGLMKSLQPHDLLPSDTVLDILRSKDRKTLKIVSEDIAELNACYKARAYKATLILAGSILEAFLLDWLSELYKVDFFKKAFLVSRTNEKGQVIRVPGVLADYINEIAEINRPDWMEEAKKAHIIRDRRNWVHAKCCLKEDVNIDGHICREVIEFLESIINTRYHKKYGINYVKIEEAIINEEIWEKFKLDGIS